MRLKKSRLLVLLALVVLVVACASTPKGRYYENLDMYDFVMTKFRADYEASTPEEQAQMEEELVPVLKEWSAANKVWKASLEDESKEKAVQLAWANARSALIRFGVVKLEEVQ